MMPVMDGFTVLAYLSSNPAWTQVPVVVVTARTLEPAEAGALSRACAAVLAKGKGDTERLVEAVLQATRPNKRARAPEASPA
jgi:CheY-like chemotaxis protein